MQKITLIGIVLVGIPSIAVCSDMETASTQRSVFVDCVLRYTTNTSCNDFKNDFFNKFGKLVARVESPAGADLILGLTDEQIDPTHVRYNYLWSSHLPGAPGTLPYPLVLPTGYDSVKTLDKLTLNAVRGLTIYVDIVTESINSDGNMAVVYGSLDSTAKPAVKPGWLDRMAQSPWEIDGSINGNQASAGSGSNQMKQTVLQSSAGLSYIKPKYKVSLASTYNFTHYSLPAGDGTQIAAGSEAKGASALAVYSVSKDWSVAVISNTTLNPGSNIQMQETLKTGVEWTLVPFRTTENRELAFRMGPEYTFLTLDQPNDQNHLRERYFGAFATIYYYWVTMQDRLKLSASLTDDENMKYKKYRTTSLGGSVTFQLNRAVALSTSAAYSLIQKSMTYPGQPNYSNPLQTTFLQNPPGRSVSISFGLSMTLGNSIRKLRDRRWTNN